MDGNATQQITTAPPIWPLLTGGTKKRQQRDIDAAHAYRQDYKPSKRGLR